MSAVERAIGHISNGRQFESVVVGLYAANSAEIVNECREAVASLNTIRSSVAPDPVEAMRRCAKAFSRAQSVVIATSDMGLVDRIAYAAGEAGSLMLSGEIDRHGLIGGIGREIGRLASRLGESGADRRDYDAMTAAMGKALDMLNGSGIGPEIGPVAAEAVRNFFEPMITTARRYKLSAELEDAVSAVNPEGGAAEVRRVIELVKRQTEGMSETDVHRYMVSGALAAIDRAAVRVGEALIAGVGPDKLPERLAGVVEKARPQEVIVGKLQAAGADDFKRMYSRQFNEAMMAVKSAVQAELNREWRKVLDEVESQYPKWGQDEEQFHAFQEAKQKAQQELYERMLAKQKADAAELVARQAGVAPVELQNRLDEIERLAEDLAEERERVGGVILEELRKMGLDRAAAAAVKRDKIRVDASAARLLAGTERGKQYDQSLTDLMQLVGAGVRDAGPVEVMGISALKKKHPRLYGGRGIKRAFCTYGYRKTASGGDDINVVGMGTESRDLTTLWHELGHWLEHNNPIVRGIVRAWFKRRTEGEKPVRLSSLIPNGGYGKNEITLRDQFLHPYMGKLYDSGSTEIVSMGLEYLSDKARAAELASKDPDMFSLIVKIIEVINEN